APHLHSIFFFSDTPSTEIYTLSLHDALPISSRTAAGVAVRTQRPTVVGSAAARVRRQPGHAVRSRTARPGRAAGSRRTATFSAGTGSTTTRCGRFALNDGFTTSSHPGICSPPKQLCVVDTNDHAQPRETE